jgi:N-acetylglucosamine-6-phosphate deacetylase
MAEVSLLEAVTMATENPGRFVGGRGRLEVGARGDLVRFRIEGRSLLIDSVFVGGESVPSDGTDACEVAAT